MSFNRNTYDPALSVGRAFLLVKAVVSLLIGAALIIVPTVAGQALATVVGIVLGLWLIIDAVLRIVRVRSRKKLGLPVFGVATAFAVVGILLGFVLLIRPAQVVGGFGLLFAWLVTVTVLMVSAFLLSLSSSMRVPAVVGVVGASVGVAVLLFAPELALVAISMLIGLVLTVSGVWSLRLAALLKRRPYDPGQSRGKIIEADW